MTKWKITVTERYTFEIEAHGNAEQQAEQIADASYQDKPGLDLKFVNGYISDFEEIKD